MLFAENNIQVTIRDDLTHIDQGELWRNFDTWRSEGRGVSVATVIGELYAPATGLIRNKLVRNTATVHRLFGLGVRYYLERNGITDQNAHIETGLRAGIYKSAHRQRLHIDYPDAESPVLRCIMTRRGGVGPTHFAIGDIGYDELDAASNFLHPERVGTEELQRLVPKPGQIVLFLGHLTLHEGAPKGQGWRETHDATAWLNSRPPASAC